MDLAKLAHFSRRDGCLLEGMRWSHVPPITALEEAITCETMQYFFASGSCFAWSGAVLKPSQLRLSENIFAMLNRPSASDEWFRARDSEHVQNP